MGDGPAMFDRLDAFARRRTAAAGLAVWAAAEAIVLPVVPDVGLCLLVLAAPRLAGRLFAAVVAGAIGGTLVLATIATVDAGAVQSMLLSLPGIDGAMVGDAGRRLERDGVLGFAQVGPGAPLKVYTSEWLSLGGDLPGLVAGSILNRLTRVGSTLLVAFAAGWLFGSWLRRHERVAIGSYAAVWIVIYAAMWT